MGNAFLRLLAEEALVLTKRDVLLLLSDLEACLTKNITKPKIKTLQKVINKIITIKDF
jgi:hypothetical protein